MEHDQSNKSPYECDCISKIISILNTENLNENSHIFDNLAKNKNCHSFTLKNGQKILKSSKIIEESKFICEIKGNLHILEDCILMQHNYNWFFFYFLTGTSFSSFIYTLKLSPYVILAIDARTSTHISRYIRRSCIPNAQLSCYINPETPQIVKTFLFSLEMIDKHKEITISVDRSKEYFIRFPSCSSKHHWQKYDYSSSLLCLCNFSTKTELESSKTTTNHQNKTTVCAVKEIKTVIKYHRNSVKKSAGVETKSSSPIIENMKSETNSEENNIPIVSVENTQGLSREQKKINYWLRVINEMEEESPKPIK
ncbi:hypothetical protein HZS_6614 [Henneguya salminicola]|nr:hypothetical protein HZS_6614 [Henneguya salminicola]